MKNHFYDNPITNRVIQSSGRTFKELKKKRFKLDPDKCLYDVKSAERCLKHIYKKYPSLFHPSTNFTDIPSTYNKHLNFIPRAFIKNKNDNINGYITKEGNLYKLPKPIKIPNNINYTIPLVKGNTKILQEKIEKDGLTPTSTEISQIPLQLNSKPLADNITILYNHIQDDFIPIKSLSFKNNKQITTILNNKLIPSQLPSLINTNISGIITDNLQSNIIGYTDSQNITKKLTSVVPINILTKKTNERKDSGFYSPNILNNIPKVNIDKKEIEKLPNANPIETVKFLNNFNKLCKEGFKYNNLTGKCFKCEDYNLEWNADRKKCIMKEKNIALINDYDDNIIGYTEYKF